jgi:hypothetical protein
MKYAQYLGLSGIMAFALSISAFAKDTHSGSFTLDDSAQVGATQLAPGKYKAEWSGPANALKIDILHNGKTVATTEGRIKDLQRPSPYDAVLVKPAANNAKALNEIDFNNRSEALILGGE